MIVAVIRCAGDYDEVERLNFGMEDLLNAETKLSQSTQKEPTFLSIIGRLCAPIPVVRMVAIFSRKLPFAHPRA